MKKRQTLQVLALFGLVGFAATAGPAVAQTIPRTSDGRPDLQGNWTNKSLTPFERPQNQPNLVLSPQEHADILATRGEAAEDRLAEGLEAVDPNNRPELGAAELAMAYDEFWYDRGTEVAIVHGEPRSSFLTIPANGRMPAYTEAAQQANAAEQAFRRQFGDRDNVELRPIAERCVAFGTGGSAPILPGGGYNNNWKIVQTPTHLVVMGEMIHDARIIPIGEGPNDPARKRYPADLRPWAGISWGWWEGDVLVVETTNGEPRVNARSPVTLFTDQAIAIAEGKKITERFSLDAGNLLYEFLIVDPAVYVEPFGGQLPMSPLDGLIYEYACHEGNYGLESVLRGARYEERMAAEGAPAARP